jgi:hypothetical protein
MKTETTERHAGEAEALILNNIGKGAPVYRPNGEGRPDRRRDGVPGNPQDCLRRR